MEGGEINFSLLRFWKLGCVCRDIFFMFPCPDKKSSQNSHPKLVDKTIEYISKCSENTGENPYGLVTFRVWPG